MSALVHFFDLKKYASPKMICQRVDHCIGCESPITIVSFDMEGTLVESSFSNLIWETDIPRLYADRHGLGFEAARMKVLEEYGEVGEHRPEWYLSLIHI